MPSSTVDTAAAVLRKAPVFAKVILVAWDPDSPAHTERMALQRVACGWKMEAIDKWRVLQREGKMTLQWVVLSDSDPEKDSKLAQHVLKYPREAAPILDTATTLGAKPRVPSSQSFIPVGHISLDAESLNPDQADASKGLYCITTFYISRAIQNCGLGRAAMDAMEREAANEPLCAKTLSLDTLANESHWSEMWAAFGMERPLFSNQDWYERRGYKVWRYVKGHIKQSDINGEILLLDAVFMKKTVA